MAVQRPDNLGDLPVVCLDETGNTGENLLDPAQPVFAMASVHLPEDVAERIVADVLRDDQDELHFLKLRKSGHGRAQALAVLEAPELTADAVSVIVMHKPFMTTGKIIDLLFEPVVDALGDDLYAGEGNVHLMQFVAARGPQACGPEIWHEFVAAAMGLIRGGDDVDLFTYQAALGRCRAVCEDEDMGRLLEMLPDSAADLLPLRRRGEDLLDPTVAAVYQQAGVWSERLGWFVLEHDKSNVLGRWRDRVLALADPAEAAKYEITDSVTLEPIRIAAMRGVESHDSPGVQIADVVAGACRLWLTAHLGLPADRAFAHAVETTGVLSRMDHFVWPPDVGVAAVVAAGR